MFESAWKKNLSLVRARSRRVPTYLAGLLLMTSPAWGEKVVGKVRGYEFLRNPVWEEAKDPENKGFSFREMVPTVPAKERQLYPYLPKEVCLVALAKESQKAFEQVTVTIGGGGSSPVTLVVPPGTSLLFKNTDPFKHRLYGKNFDGLSVADTLKGSSRQWKVPAAGVFEIRDERAPSLRIWVVAEPRVAAVSYPSPRGDFQLDVKEPGKYQVQAYFAGQSVGKAREFQLKNRKVKLPTITLAKAPPAEAKK
ncbi:MAG: hypothetical protein MK135_16500 [Polyangiaceae bacterium]|nr:hypothetical protein [Polyangiaceae bacterium]